MRVFLQEERFFAFSGHFLSEKAKKVCVCEGFFLGKEDEGREGYRSLSVPVTSATDGKETMSAVRPRFR